MATPTKVIQTQLLAWTDIATANQQISAAFDVSTKFAAQVFIHLARKTGTGFTSGWPNARVEASGKSSGNDAWYPVAQVQMAVGASIANTTTNGSISAAASTFVVTANTNMAAGDLLFLEDTSTANYEIVRIKSLSGTTITPEENVTFAHATGKIVTDQAEVYALDIDCRAITRLRVVIDNANSGQTIAAEVSLITFDSVA